MEAKTDTHSAVFQENLLRESIVNLTATSTSMGYLFLIAEKKSIFVYFIKKKSTKFRLSL